MDPGTRRWYQTRFGLSRENIRSNEIGVGNTAQQFGIPNVNVDELPKGLPLISFPGLDIIGAKDNIPAIIVSQNTQFGDNLDAVLGNHSLKVGFGVIFRQTNAYQSSFSRSQFASTTIYTSNPAVTGISGNGAAFAPWPISLSAVRLAAPRQRRVTSTGASAYNGSCRTTRSWRSTMREARRQSVRGQPDRRSASGPGSIQVRRPYPTFGDITYNGQDASTLWRPISEFYSTEAKARSAEAERHSRRFQEMQPKRPPRL